MSTTGPDRDYRIAVVAKAMRLLDAFSAPPHRFSLTELSGRTGLSTNQTFRLLQTLVATGWVRQTSEGKIYSLGQRAFGLVPALFQGDELVVAARETLQWVHESTGETVALIVPAGTDHDLCIDVRECAHRLNVATGLGSRVSHLHAGAAAKVLLAARGDACVAHYLATHRPLERLTRWTPATAEAVWEEIRRVRAQGYAIGDQEVAEGMYDVAAPIRDRRGDVVAAVTLAAPLTRSGPRERAEHLAMIVEAGKRISANLGFRDAPEGG